MTLSPQSAYRATSGNGQWLFGMHRPFQQRPAQTQAQAAPSAPKVDQELLKRLQAQYGRLTGQASDALYGGILGYNPKPMTAMGGQQFAAPQGDLQLPFGNMQGLLGQPQKQQFMPQMGGMGEMMQPKMRMY
jgi:hypothetical protein